VNTLRALVIAAWIVWVSKSSSFSHLHTLHSLGMHWSIYLFIQCLIEVDKFWFETAYVINKEDFNFKNILNILQLLRELCLTE